MFTFGQHVYKVFPPGFVSFSDLVEEDLLDPLMLLFAWRGR